MWQILLAVVICLVFLIGDQLRLQEGLTNYKYEPNTDYFGNDARSKSDQLVTDCLVECSNDPACKRLATTRPASNTVKDATCWFKNANSVTANNRATLAGIYTWTKQDSITPGKSVRCPKDTAVVNYQFEPDLVKTGVGDANTKYKLYPYTDAAIGTTWSSSWNDANFMVDKCEDSTNLSIIGTPLTQFVSTYSYAPMQLTCQVQYIKLIPTNASTSNCIQAAQIEVFAGNTTNIATGKTVLAASTLNAFTTAAVAIDGTASSTRVLNTITTTGNIFHSKCNSGDFWELNLLAPFTVTSIVYSGRGERLKYVADTVLNTTMVLLDKSKKVIRTIPFTSSAQKQTFTFTTDNCPDSTTIKKDSMDDKCFGKCTDGTTYKLNASDTCFGLCPGSTTLYKTDAAGSQCFGLCPAGSLAGQVYKSNALGTNCFGSCPAGSALSYKTAANDTCFGTCPTGAPLTFKNDATGSQCFGLCPPDSAVNGVTPYKTDLSGTQCYGRCPAGAPLTWKNDVSGSQCWGKCTWGPNTTSVYKIDISGTNCYGTCPAGSVLTYKNDLAGSQCFGKCTVGNTALYKIDVSGTNCHGYCTNDLTKYKKDASGTECFGPCPSDAPNRWKTDLSGSRCWGLCTVGDTTTYKSDLAGSNCYGACPPGAPNAWKTDSAGSRCWGPCPTGAPNAYKTDLSGSRCYGVCQNNTNLYKIDNTGTNCFGKCSNDATKWKTDASGSKCFGKCSNNADLWKVDNSGSNCFGTCENNPARFKADASGTNCSNPNDDYNSEEDLAGISPYSMCTSFAPYDDDDEYEL